MKGQSCPIQYYLDGVPMSGTVSVDRLVSPAEVGAVEVYTASGYVPPQFSGPSARCGVIALWRRSR